MNIKDKIKLVIKKAEELDWSVTVSDYKNDWYSFNFQKFSPAGQDFNIFVDLENCDIKTLIDGIYDKYYDYDVSYETYLWLDCTGHGKNGAPYDIKDIYNDMEVCESYIFELWWAISEVKELEL